MSADQPVPPSGTVTFLFTDIEGSTGAWERDRESMEAALERHDELLRSTVGSYSGYVFSTGGDGFGVAFSRSEEALAAAAEAQRRLAVEVWPGEFRVRVRMGVHTGEAQERDGNYFGPALNRAARLMGLAVGGQVLVSGATSQIVADRLGNGLELAATGEVWLRGVGEPVAVHLLMIDGVPTPEVVPWALGAGNLPGGLVEPVRRDVERGVLAGALADHQLVTVIGVGGVGKTALALAVAADAAGFDGGVWLVELAPVSDAGDVAGAVGRSLGLTAGPGFTISETIVEWFRYRRALLVLDNCEHVIRGVADLVDDLTAAAADLRILATSREALFSRGEHVMPLGPLAIDDGSSPAVELFGVRASEADPDFDLDGHRDEVVELCRHLDGLPLAIELAAARMRSLTPGDVIGHLEERFRLLTGSRRTATERHQTLRAAIGWSYDLLGDAERLVFDRVSVFMGRFSHEDAAAVAADEQLDEIDVLDLVASLVDKSLLEADGGDPRFRLLETVRAYGRERLESGGEADEVRRRHALRLQHLASEALDACVGPREVQAGEAVLERLTDYQAAANWAIDNDELDLAIKIVVDLGTAGTMWNMRQAASWVTELADQPPDPLPPQWAELLAVSANYQMMTLGNPDRAEDLAQAALAIDSGEPRGHEIAAVLAMNQGQWDEADRLATTAVEAARNRGNRIYELWAQAYRAWSNIASGDRDASQAAIDEIAVLAATSRSATVEAILEISRGRLQLGIDAEQARSHLRRAIRAAGTNRSAPFELMARRDLVASHVDHDTAAVGRDLLDLLERCVEVGEYGPAIKTSQLVATVLAELDEPRAAARIIGAVGLHPSNPVEEQRIAAIEERLKTSFGASFGETLEQGATDRLPQTIDIATEALRTRLAN